MRVQSPLPHSRSLPLPHTNETVLAGIRGLAPEITERAAEIEAARRIPPDLVERLRSIGMFRIFVPRSHGGLELPLPEGLEVITALARLDGDDLLVAAGARVVRGHRACPARWIGRLDLHGRGRRQSVRHPAATRDL